jgi:hypothetical protein
LEKKLPIVFSELFSEMKLEKLRKIHYKILYKSRNEKTIGRKEVACIVLHQLKKKESK